jgi:hypothetical protein
MGEICLSATLSTTNFTRTGRGSKPDLLGERPSSWHSPELRPLYILKVQRLWPVRATKGEGTSLTASYNLATFPCNSQVFPRQTFQQPLKLNCHPEDGGSKLVRNVGQHYKKPQPRHCEDNDLQNSNCVLMLLKSETWD